METIIVLPNGLEIIPVSDGWMVDDSECTFFFHSNTDGGDELISLEIL